MLGAIEFYNANRGLPFGEAIFRPLSHYGVLKLTLRAMVHRGLRRYIAVGELGALALALGRPLGIEYTPPSYLQIMDIDGPMLLAGLR